MMRPEELHLTFVMSPLGSARLLIRPFEQADVESVHEINLALNPELRSTSKEQKEVIQGYLLWSSLNHTELARLEQPPYGDRAVILKHSGELIGMCGLVPYIAPLHQFPSFGARRQGRSQAAMGLYWAITPIHQRRGYATEAGRALIDFAFERLRLDRVIATTGYRNLASQAVMRKLGMRLEENPFRDAPSIQVLGILESSKPV